MRGTGLIAVFIGPFLLTIIAVAFRPAGRRTLLPLKLWVGLLGAFCGMSLSGGRGGEASIVGPLVAEIFGTVTLAAILTTHLVLWAWPRTRWASPSPAPLIGFFLGGIPVGFVLGYLR